MQFPAIWHIFLGSEWPQISFKIGPLLNKKNSSGHDFNSHTRTYTPTLPKIPRISATIKSKFIFKNISSDIVYNVKKIKLTLPKIGGPGPPGSAHAQLTNTAQKIQACKETKTFDGICVELSGSLMHILRKIKMYAFVCC